MVIVYTAILGYCDSLKPAPTGADRAVCLSDISHLGIGRGWEIVRFPMEGWAATDNPRRDAWSLRSLSHKVFPEADVTIWIDASFTMTNLGQLLIDSEGHDLSVLRHHKRKSCYEEAAEVVRVGQADKLDVRRQMDQYREDGFDPACLSISCIVVRKNTPRVTEFNELWDAETRLNPGDNTQLSLDYCAWKAGIFPHALKGVRKDNPYAVHDHDDHKRRRQPYR